MKNTRRPKQARSKETVRLILDATDRLLGTGGFAGLTTSRVAADAGVSVGTLYDYFPTKEALRRASEERSWASLSEVVTAHAATMTGRTIDDRIRGLVAVTMNELFARGAVHGVTPTSDPEALAERSAMIERFAQAAAAGLVEDHKERLRPANMALAMEIAIRSVLSLAWLGGRDHPEHMRTGAYQREVATMISAFLLRDPTAGT